MSKPQPAPWFRWMIVCLLAPFCVAHAQTERCGQGPKVAALRNATSVITLPWAPFGRMEIGWAIYEPLVAREIGTSCPAASPGFAAAVSRWRQAHDLGDDGALDQASLLVMKQIWQQRRPFVPLSHAACPAPPPAAALSRGTPSEGYGGKVIWLRTGALAAYRRMVAAARSALGPAAADPRLFTLFSAYRSPAYDAARCALQKNCQGVVRASCSAHRTGLAMDIYLGNAPGRAPDSSDDVNRLAISRTPAYRWMVANAGRFGFVNYPFEPWHWEWTGEAP